MNQSTVGPLLVIGAALVASSAPGIADDPVATPFDETLPATESASAPDLPTLSIVRSEEGSLELHLYGEGGARYGIGITENLVDWRLFEVVEVPDAQIPEAPYPPLVVIPAEADAAQLFYAALDNRTFRIEPLHVDGQPVADAVVDDLNHTFSFPGIAGIPYAVTLTPASSTDDPDLLVFDDRENMFFYWNIADDNGGEDSEAAREARIGKSDNPPGQIDSVNFTAAATQDYYIMLSGPEGQTASYALQVNTWAPEVPSGDPFDIELKDGQSTSTEILHRGADFTAENTPGSYEMEATVYDDGEAFIVRNILELRADGTGTMHYPEGEYQGDETPLEWSAQDGSLVVIERDDFGDMWVWVFTNLDSGSTLIQVKTPPGQEDSADFAIIGSFEKTVD